jgi:DNA-binding transcriptional LysR family regulator
VHVAQPGVSAQARRLESELGQQLLDRSGRSVRLTEVGSAMVVQLAARGLGLAVVPASTVPASTVPASTVPAATGTAATGNAPRILRITDPRIRSRLELAWNLALSANPAARVLVEHAQTVVSPSAATLRSG